MCTDTTIAKLEPHPGSNTPLPTTPSENFTGHRLQIVINRKTGTITRVYAEEAHEPCVLCDNRSTCDKSKLNPCHIFCG